MVTHDTSHITMHFISLTTTGFVLSRIGIQFHRPVTFPARSLARLKSLWFHLTGLLHDRSRSAATDCSSHCSHSPTISGLALRIHGISGLRSNSEVRAVSTNLIRVCALRNAHDGASKLEHPPTLAPLFDSEPLSFQKFLSECRPHAHGEYSRGARAHASFCQMF